MGELPNRKKHRIWTELLSRRKHQMAKKHRMVKKHRILRMVETFGMNLNPYFRPLRRAQDQRNRKRYRRVWTELQNQRKHQMVKKHRRIWTEPPNPKKDQIHWTELLNR